MTKKRICAQSLLAATALFAGVAAVPAHGANTSAVTTAAGDSASADYLESVIVTAEKRAEDQQKTPIAMSVLNAEAIENRHIQSLNDLKDGAIPSLQVAPFYSRNSALVMNIRGVGVLSDSNQPARDQGVGVYIDGVYLGRPQALASALYDIENIVVLKGPQGTLFGRNTEGGAVDIVTRKPTGEFGMTAQLGVGDYGSYTGTVRLDLPKFNNIAVKLDGVVMHRDGFVTNPLSGQWDFNAYDKHGIRAQVLWTPLDNLSVNYSYDNARDASSPLYMQAISKGAYGLPSFLSYQSHRASNANIGVPQQASVGLTQGHGLTIDWRVSDALTIKSIASYRRMDQTQFDNGSTNATVLIPNSQFSRYSLAPTHQYQYSEEVQAIGEYDRLKYVAGVLYYHEHAEDNAQAFYTAQMNATGTSYSILQVNIATVSLDRASRVSTDSIGIYGQATYTPPVLEDRLHLTAGGRYSRDDKKGELFIVNGATPVVNGVAAPQTLNKGWNRIDPLANISFDVTEDVQLYGKWSSGYRSGGANSRSLTYAPFNPETVSMFEVGGKSEFFGHRARFNFAAYGGDYKNIQIDFSANYLQYDKNGNLLTTTRTTTETFNAPGTGHLYGAEAELSVVPITGLTLTANYAYSRVEIPSTANPFPQTNGVINTTPVKIYPVYTPINALSGSADYEMPFKDFTLLAHIDANWNSGYYTSYNDPAVGVRQPRGESGVITNARLSISDIALNTTGTKLELSLWSRNLFNEEHLFYKTFSPLAGTFGFFNDARTYGGEIKVNL